MTHFKLQEDGSITTATILQMPEHLEEVFKDYIAIDIYGSTSMEEIDGVYTEVITPPNWPYEEVEDMDATLLTEDNLPVMKKVPREISYPIWDETLQSVVNDDAKTAIELIKSYEVAVDKYIQDEVIKYNKESGYSFTDINAFTKYALLPHSKHYNIARSFIDWADLVWDVSRAVQREVVAGNREMPSIEEFLVELPNLNLGE